MADKTEFLQAIDDAILDADSLEKFINGSDSETVLTRLSAEYPTLQNALRNMFKNGGLPATPFKTAADMTASELENGSYAIVTEDGDNNGLYIKELGVWNKSEHSYDNIIRKILEDAMGYKNIFDGRYHRVYLTGSSADDARLRMRPAGEVEPSSAIISVKPNTKYRIINPTETDVFVVALLTGRLTDAYPAPGENISRLFARDSVKKGEIEFTTLPDETVLVVNIAITTANDAAPLYVYELSGENNWLSLGKNILPPVYERGWDYGVGSDPNAGINAFLPNPNGVVMRCNIKPNTTYTVSKEPSSKFTVLEVVDKIVNSTYMLRTRYFNVSSTETEVTFTTSADAFMLKIHVSDVGEEPFVQVEEGSERTSWQRYGLQIVNGVQTESDNKYSGSGGVYLNLNPNDDNIADTLTEAFRKSSGKVVYINSGTYLLNKPLLLPSNITVVGLGDVVLKMADDMAFEPDEFMTWRNNKNKKSILRSDINSKNITLENLTVEGADEFDYSYMHWGIALQGSGHILRNVNIRDINFIADNARDRRSGGDGWCLTFINAKNCRVYGGSFERGGYENIGTENSEDIVFDGVYLGEAWRTTIQFHQGSRKMRLVNSVVNQKMVSPNRTHAAVTFHGKEDNIVNDIVIANNIIDSIVSETLHDQSPNKKYGCIQGVEGHEHNVTVTGNTIRTNKDALIANSEGAGFPRNWIMIGNRVAAGRYSFVVRGGSGGIVANNIIEAGFDTSIEDSSVTPPDYEFRYLVANNLFKEIVEGL